MPLPGSATERGHERWLLATTVVLALLVPVAAAWYLDRRIDRDLEPALADALGAPVSVDHAEASLTGAFRLDGVRVGDVFEAGSIEASIAPGSLFAGRLEPDEIRVDRPRVRLRVDRDGASNLAPLLARWRARRACAAPPCPTGGDGSRGRLRRVVVTGGDLVVSLGDHGHVRVRGLELRPRPGGLRVIAGAAELDGGSGPWTMTGRFERGAADLSLPALRVDRALAVGGTIDLAAVGADGGARAGLRTASLSCGIGGGGRECAWRLAAAVAQAGRDARVSATYGGHAVALDLQGVPLAMLAPLLPRGLALADARATGTATLARAGGLAIDADVALAGGTLDHRRIAPVAVPLDGHLRLRTHITSIGPLRQVVVDDFAYVRGALELRGHGNFAVAPGDHLPRRADLHAELVRGDCAALLAGLPPPLRDRLGGLQLRGQAGAELALAWDLATPDDTRLAATIDTDACDVVAEPLAADPRSLLEPFDHTWPDGSVTRIGMGEGDYVTLRSLPRHLPGAFVAAEDARFYDHHGFDLRQIERSLAINLADRGLTRGGSTISQQLVKNAFLGPERTLARKLQEAVLTWRLEAHVGKRLILERYLNLIELGPGIHGVGAAARYWFGKPATQLSPLESAFLAALTPAPTTVSAALRAAGRVDDATAERIHIVLRHMKRAGVIDDATYERLRYERPTIRPPSLASR
ncbi:MAG TPA: biosynthetic peptidoglycan transglycosylase [Kofleriaceae bacterium]|nr:biosynthetic peptidoglycan transglycosylase [Kofleriaceae bacterium]